MQSFEPKSLSNFNLVKYSIEFFGRHFILIFGAGLIAGVGRTIQLGAIGEISGGADSFLELVIATARILTFILILGEGRISIGVQRVRSIFQLNRAQWQSIGLNIITRLKSNWLALLINLIVYSAIAMIINYLIDKIAYNSNLLKALQNSHILAANTTEWVILLFFKNITVIPFTIIFNGFVLLWVANSGRFSKKSFGRTI